MPAPFSSAPAAQSNPLGAVSSTQRLRAAEPGDGWGRWAPGAGTFRFFGPCPLGQVCINTDDFGTVLD